MGEYSFVFLKIRKFIIAILGLTLSVIVYAEDAYVYVRRPLFAAMKLQGQTSPSYNTVGMGTASNTWAAAMQTSALPKPLNIDINGSYAYTLKAGKCIKMVVPSGTILLKFYYTQSDVVNSINVSLSNGESLYLIQDDSGIVHQDIPSNIKKYNKAKAICINTPPYVPNVEKGETLLAASSIDASNLQKAKSDVDTNIPLTNKTSENTFVVIVANENYRREKAVEYALNDGNTFSEYCKKTLGIPEKNIRICTDATFLDMKAEVEWLTNVSKAYGGDARLVFYYAGHGIPDESTKDAYLLPVDGMGSNPSTGYKLSNLYSSLGEANAESSIVLLDACFSGAQRNGEMMASARGVAIKAKAADPKNRMVVLSAATGDETAYPYYEKGHGLFTYYLLKILQDTKGQATLGEISDFVTTQVGRKSMVENSKSQTPTVTASSDLADTWKSMKLF